MKKTLAVFALAGVCSFAGAASKLIWQVSTDDGATWSTGTGILAPAGSKIKLRALADRTGTTAYGFSGLTQKIFIDNYDPEDPGALVNTNGVGNRLAPFNFGAATLATRVTGTTQRIYSVGIGGAENNISSGQQAPASAGTNYSTANPTLLFTFEYEIGPVHGRTLTIRSDVAPSSGVPSAFSYHAAQTSSSTNFRETGVVESVSIEIIPDTICGLTEQPGDAALLPGGVATFSTAFPQADAIYQWRKGGVELVESSRIVGVRTPTLVINDVRSEDQGGYDCRVTSICNPVTTRQALLICKTGFEEQPEGGTVAARDMIELHAATIQASGVTFRWRKDGIGLFNSAIYSGVSTPTLTIHTFDPSQSGAYSLAATNACGTAISEAAAVTVYCPSDFNGDDFIDFSDFDAFVAAFGAGESRGDFNRDGFLDFADFDDFVVAFESGC